MKVLPSNYYTETQGDINSRFPQKKAHTPQLPSRSSHSLAREGTFGSRFAGGHARSPNSPLCAMAGVSGRGDGRGVCFALPGFQENSDIVTFVIQCVFRTVQPHDLFKGHARHDTS